MKKISLFLVCATMLVISFLASLALAEVGWEDIGRGNMDFRSVFVYPDGSSIIIAGTGNALLRSEDSGKNWRMVLGIRGDNKAVNFLCSDFKEKNSLYAATGNGLYKSPDRGKSWARVFKGKGPLENESTVVADLPYGTFLGTKAGLFVSNDNGRSWHKEKDGISDTAILAIAWNLKQPDCVYLACVAGAFVSKDKGRSWQKIFLAQRTENRNGPEEKAYDFDEVEKVSNIRYIAVDPNSMDCIYLVTSRGIYRSNNKGGSWEVMPDYGLLDRDIESLIVSQRSEVYAVSQSGVFIYRLNRWEELSFRLTGKIRKLILDNQDNLFAACDKGLFRAYTQEGGSSVQGDILTQYSKNELSIREVQKAAIGYAEVEPGKIIKWRKQAARKALLPQVSIGIDRNTSDLWHWEGGSTTKVNDDILRRGRDSIDWDVTLSWNLGELIWNDDQANIDVRSKLMVELRDDILDEVTKLYFERLRVKAELGNLTIEDRKRRFEKEIRLQELTASLDGLTGGYFSDNF